MRKALVWGLALGCLTIVLAAYPVIAQSQGQSPRPMQPGQQGQQGQQGQMGQPGQRGQFAETAKPLVNASDFKQLEEQHPIPLSQAIQSAESQNKGKAVAVIPVRSSSGLRYNVYTTQDGQLTLHEIDARTGQSLGQHMANAITELSMSRYAGHEEMGGPPPWQPRGGQGYPPSGSPPSGNPPSGNPPSGNPPPRP